MGRFLIFFSYFGTRYSGVQQQAGSFSKGKPVRTVGGVLQEALKHLRPSNEVSLTVSSRTDKGVHALKNSCHVDLVHPCAGEEYSPAVVTNVLNYHLRNQGEDIRVVETRQIPDRFHSRFKAINRKYVYRLGFMTNPSYSEDFVNELKKFSAGKSRHPVIPLEEQLSTFDTDKALIFRTPLDMNKLISAAEMLSGIHNYWSFANHGNSGMYHPHPVKMLTIGVKRGQPLGHHLLRFISGVTGIAENLEFWDIHIQSSSFMYKQIRKLVGGMVLVAKDMITLDELRGILEYPQNDFPFLGRMHVKEQGLFLVEVGYRAKDFELNQSATTHDLDLGVPTINKDHLASASCSHDQDENGTTSDSDDNDGDDKGNDKVGKTSDCRADYELEKFLIQIRIPQHLRGEIKN